MFDSTGWFLDEKDGCIDPWPLTTPIGSLDCFESGPNEVQGFVILWATYSDAEGPKWYALNNIAIAAAPLYDFLDVDDIRKDDPDGSNGSKLDLEPLLELGLSLCEYSPQ